MKGVDGIVGVILLPDSFVLPGAGGAFLSDTSIRKNIKEENGKKEGMGMKRLSSAIITVAYRYYVVSYRTLEGCAIDAVNFR